MLQKQALTCNPYIGYTPSAPEAASCPSVVVSLVTSCNDNVLPCQKEVGNFDQLQYGLTVLESFGFHTTKLESGIGARSGCAKSAVWMKRYTL